MIIVFDSLYLSKIKFEETKQRTTIINRRFSVLVFLSMIIITVVFAVEFIYLYIHPAGKQRKNSCLLLLFHIWFLCTLYICR